MLGKWRHTLVEVGGAGWRWKGLGGGGRGWVEVAGLGDVDYGS